MIHTGPEPSIEIPETDVTSFVLGEASRRGEQDALVDGPSGWAITYGNLADQVRGLAAGFAARGIGKGDVVAIYMPNLPEYALPFHGVCSAGAVNTTVNPLYTARELAYQLRDSGARMLVTVPPFLNTAREAAEEVGGIELVVVGEAEGATPLAELIEAGAEPPEVEIDPDRDLAVLPYSSGTTGMPKGVMLTHRNLVANINQANARIALGPGDVVIGSLPFFHIFGMTVIMNMGLRNGAKIVTMPRFDLDQFLDLIERHRATHLFIVPPIALALAKHPAVEGSDLSSLRVVNSGAAPLSAELVDQVSERIGCVVMQGYGLTETSPVTHCNPIDPERVKPGTIGPPLPDTECRLVDPESGEDLGTGERGELWIRGPQVMSGYLNNPEATAATLDEDGWLHTGDVAVVDEDGYFQIVDRLKELIKYKGFQVPPAELEALLVSHPAVADVAVIGVPDEEAGELPKAFVVAGDEVSDEELLEFVAERVSPQKRIRLIERVDEIPKSPSGKILRRVLAEREAATP
ncbi:MAG: 4-coumarate--CoA ligase family protein [Solirubrobacterales bacterium]